jgi:hypothetical protein
MARFMRSTRRAGGIDCGLRQAAARQGLEGGGWGRPLGAQAQAGVEDKAGCFQRFGRQHAFLC